MALIPPPEEEFLDFLFSTIARRPPDMTLREAAGVARYLDELAYRFRGDKRKQLRGLSQAIWKQALQSAEIRLPRKSQVTEFLKRFSETHLGRHNVEAAVETVRDTDPPVLAKPVPQLRGAYLAVTLDPDGQRLSDDVSERISVGYWFLRSTDTDDARGKVAAALNRHHVPKKSRDEATQTWAGSDVAERVKQYERQLAASVAGEKAAKRDWLVQKWLSLYQDFQVSPQRALDTNY